MASSGGGLALAAALLLAGCLPWPHRDRLAPEIRGVLREGAEPLAFAHVRLDTSSDSSCTAPVLSAETDASGAFVIGPVRSELRWLVLIIADPLARWTFCVDTGSGRRTLLRQGGIGMPPGKLEVACDLEASGTQRIEAFGSIEGICAGKSGW